MNKNECKLQISEIISLVKCAGVIDNDALSQNVKAVTPNRQNWLFYCSNNLSYLTIPPYTGIFCLSFMVWLILQNKPFGEYAKRYLLQPRVRPHRPFLGLLTQNVKGVFK